MCDVLLSKDSKDLDVERRGIAFGDLIDTVAGYEPEVMRQGAWSVRSQSNLRPV